MLSTLSQTQKGIFCALAGYSAFVVSDTSSKFLAASYPVFMVVGWMYFFALILGIISSPWTGGLKRTFQTKKMAVHIGRGLFNFGLAVTVVTAFQHLPMTSVYPVLFLAPFLITILAIPIYKEHVRPINWAIILLGFCGVLIAFRPWAGNVNPWIISAFLCIFCISGLGLLARKLDERETILSLSFYPNLVNVILLFPLSLVLFPLPQLAHIPIFILGGIGLNCGMTGVATACRLTRYAIIAPLNYTQLILVFIAGYMVFGEIPDIWMVSGSIIIAMSGILLALSNRSKAICAPPATLPNIPSVS